MEKTLEFAINEALESGRRSAMPQFLEMELRENIAQEIESRGADIASMWVGIGGRTPQAIDWFINDVKFFANIVRGKKESNDLNWKEQNKLRQQWILDNPDAEYEGWMSI